MNQTIAPTGSRGGLLKRNFRWLIIGLFIIGVTLNYVSRNSLGLMSVELMRVLDIDTDTYGYIQTAFQIAYTLFQPICGWLIDVVGLKISFAICAAIWSVVCIFHAGAFNWVHFAVLRFFMGATEAVAAPANAKVMTEWFPKKERPVANGWGGVGFSLGGVIAPPLIGIGYYFWGWHGAFVLPGMLGLFWATAWFKMYTPPAENKHISEEERNYILSGQDPPFTGKKPSLGKALGTLLATRRFYGIGIPAFLSEPAWQALGIWVPIYMSKVHSFQLKDILLYAWLPFLMADLGSLASGYMVPMLRKHFGTTQLNAAIATAWSGALIMLCLAVAAFVSNPYVAIALISMGGLGHQIISSMLGVLVMETTPAHQVATANGLRGSCAWIAAAISTIVIGFLTSAKGLGVEGFFYVFIALGLFDLIGTAIMTGILWEKKKADATA